MLQAIEALIESITIQGDPNPGSFLGYSTDPGNMSDVLTMEELSVFLCHNVRQHVMYFEEDAGGKKHYECLECTNGT